MDPVNCLVFMKCSHSEFECPVFVFVGKKRNQFKICMSNAFLMPPFHCRCFFVAIADFYFVDVLAKHFWKPLDLNLQNVVRFFLDGQKWIIELVFSSNDPTWSKLLSRSVCWWREQFQNSWLFFSMNEKSGHMSELDSLLDELHNATAGGGGATTNGWFLWSFSATWSVRKKADWLFYRH